MNDAFYIAATGMRVQQTNVETISNNLVNANTPGFKRSQMSFTDMVVAQSAPLAHGEGADAADLLGRPAMAGVGVVQTGIARQLDAGELKKTDAPFDLAIAGDGFMEVAMPDGSRGFVRGGSLKVNRDGMLATQAGLPLKPGIAIPENMQQLTISATGLVQARVAGQATPVELGQLDLVRFANPGQLEAGAENVYKISADSGEPQAGEGVGSLAQGYLEGSNVKMVDEMVNLMLAQRAYEISVKVVQAADEMQVAVNNLRK